MEAVYLRIGNLLVTIILHVLHDIVSMMDASIYVSDGVQKALKMQRIHRKIFVFMKKI